MIWSINGKIILKNDSFVVLETGGVSFKILIHRKTYNSLPKIGDNVKMFCHLYFREGIIELYGFCSEKEKALFEILNSVAGVGPKSALSILDISEYKELVASISNGRPDILSRASGIGRKTAERIILELKNKVDIDKSEDVIRKIEIDNDIIETLANLGYSKNSIRIALKRIGDRDIDSIEKRLKAALNLLNKDKTKNNSNDKQA